MLKIVKVHLYKSELALAITSIEERESKRKPSGVEEDLYKSTLTKLRRAYSNAER